jgi:hypothetical protein
MSIPLRRRELFTSAAAMALLAPVLRAEEARAQGAGIKRFVTLCHPNGNDYGAPGQGGPHGASTGFNFGPFYQALERHRSDCIALTGMRLGGIPWGTERPDEVGHASGGWACLTARSSQGTSSATGPSVDQFIAKKLFEQQRAPTANAPVFRVGALSSSSWQSHYEAARLPVPHISTPTQAFSTLFRNVMGGGSTGSQAVAQAVARKRSILDAAWQDCRGALTVLPASGRVQVDEYCQRIRDLETSLQTPVVPSGPTCTAPAVGTLATINPDDPANYAAITAFFFQCIEAAFVCDVTRVASFTFGSPSVRFNMPWLGLPSYDFGSGITGSDHHTYSHGALPTQLTRFVNWYAQRFGELLDRLAARQTDGSRLLDSTLVYWTGEIGNSYPAGAGGALHDVASHTMFLFGSMGGLFRTGRLHAYPSIPFANYQSATAKADATRHHALLVSLIQAMGITGVNQFGDPNGGSGPLQALYT